MWGQCLGHKRATMWPFLGKGATGFFQKIKILHGASLGTLIKIHEEHSWRTMCGPCFGHKRAIFWSFLGKGDYGIHKNCEIWHQASLGTLIIIQEEPNLKDHARTMFWPWKGHILVISRKRGWWDTSRIVKFCMDHPLADWLWFMKNQLEEPCEDPVLAIKGLYFGNF